MSELTKYEELKTVEDKLKTYEKNIKKIRKRVTQTMYRTLRNHKLFLVSAQNKEKKINVQNVWKSLFQIEGRE